MSQNTFNSLSKLALPERSVHVFQLDRLPDPAAVKKLPFCMKVLLENLLRNEDGVNVDADAILAVMNWANAQPEPDSASESQQTSSQDLAFSPARVVLQDFTGVPAVVDLAAMRDAITELGGDAEQINPLVPVDLVIDHSVMVDYFGDDAALQNNIAKEFERNQERYAFLRWGQQAFRNFRVVPPGTGIVHQVNLEYLANVVTESERDGSHVAYPDSLVGTDSHTTMINGLGVVGWGVGGIEAEAAMLGQPLSLLLPTVVGVKLTGQLSTGVTATDMVLRVTEMLRNHGVVGKFVEFYGDGLDDLTLADRATIANMAPEYGATMGIFPIDQETLKYLQLTGRSAQQITLVEQYAKRQGMWREPGESLVFSEYLELDLSSIQPSLAGPSAHKIVYCWRMFPAH